MRSESGSVGIQPVISGNANLAKVKPVPRLDSFKVSDEVMVDFGLQFSCESAQLTKSLRGENASIVQIGQSARDEMKGTIEQEQGLIDSQPVPAGKMGISHDAPQTCFVVRDASVSQALAHSAFTAPNL